VVWAWGGTSCELAGHELCSSCRSCTRFCLASRLGGGAVGQDVQHHVEEIREGAGTPWLWA
jgi:hypothetical protein